MRPALTVLASLALSTCIYAQSLSVGVVGGAGLTDSFAKQTFPASLNLPITTFYSASKDYVVGPSLELHFTPNWSVEVEGLFRKLHLEYRSGFPNQPVIGVSRSPVITWEFPVLAKYRVKSQFLQPLFELGPSFRTAGNLNGTNPSHVGVTAGVGLDFKIKGLVFEPVLRYTHWAEDGPRFGAFSSPNQLELLLGVSATARNRWRPLGNRASVGGLVGVEITNSQTSSVFNYVSFSQSFKPVRSALGGVTGAFAFTPNLSVQVDAVYHRLLVEGISNSNGVASVPFTSGNSSWEIPVLAQWKFASSLLAPFVEAGPSFRLPSGNLSNFGAAAGIGVEGHFGALKIAPLIRYTRWGESLHASSPVPPNQVVFLVRVTL
jgi:hypothetical protein